MKRKHGDGLIFIAVPVLDAGTNTRLLMGALDLPRDTEWLMAIPQAQFFFSLPSAFDAPQDKFCLYEVQYNGTETQTRPIKPGGR
jgi:hypothetical protein